MLRLTDDEEARIAAGSVLWRYDDLEAVIGAKPLVLEELGRAIGDRRDHLRMPRAGFQRKSDIVNGGTASIRYRGY